MRITDQLSNEVTQPLLPFQEFFNAAPNTTVPEYEGEDGPENWPDYRPTNNGYTNGWADPVTREVLYTWFDDFYTVPLEDDEVGALSPVPVHHDDPRAGERVESGPQAYFGGTTYGADHQPYPYYGKGIVMKVHILRSYLGYSRQEGE